MTTSSARSAKPEWTASTQLVDVTGATQLTTYAYCSKRKRRETRATDESFAAGRSYPYRHALGRARHDTEKGTIMNWRLEVIVVPVSDVDRAKEFYADRLGFDVDHDTRIGDEARVVQLTPPGSGCSIVIGEGVVPEMPGGSLKGLQLVVPDVKAARAELIGRGVEVSELQVLGESPSPVADPLDNVGFVFFADPDGNGWAVQQISARE